MSYILDALKKLESEKAKKIRNDGVMNLSGALLQDTPRRSSGRTTGKIAAVVIIVALVAFGGGWFLMRGDKREKRPEVAPLPAVAVQPKTPPAPPAVPPMAPPPPVTAVQPPVPASAPPLPLGTTGTPLDEQQRPRIVAPPSPDDAEDIPPARRALRQHKEKDREVPPPEGMRPMAQAPVLSAPPADIKVSGIAWQDERSARRAVINGFLLREGSTVSGARITEILRDRVRFSAGDKVFEAPLLMNNGLPGK